MPDWTYIPLRDLSSMLLRSEQRSRRAAVGLVSNLARLPGGERVIRSFDYTHDLPAAEVTSGATTYPSPIGVEVDQDSPATDRALRAMGFGFVAPSDALPAGARRSEATTVDALVAELDNGAELLVANAATIELGPTTAQRVNEIVTQRENERHGFEPQPVDWLRPWTWQAWVWAMWLGVAMICGGIGATLITVGPVLLPYDEDFLQVSVDDLRAFNDNLIPFLQHDRITMAGCMAAIGINDIGFALAMRRGWPWARAGFLAAGAIGFPTFFLFLGYEFFDPLHFAVAVGFFPLYLGGVFGPKADPTWRVPIEVDEPQRRAALDAQLMMVMLAVGVFLSGIVIMVIGLRDVLIPSDRVFLDAEQSTFEAALDGRLLRFIAHDRAGFGGALASLGLGLLTMTLWGWRSGERSTWWSLLGAAIVGFGAALSVHLVVGYTDLFHLAPVYLGIVWMAIILVRSKAWFFATV